MLVAMLTLSAHAQNLLDPLPVVGSKEATVELTDGTTLTGDPKIAMSGMGNVKKVTLALPDGTKRELEPTEVVRMVLVPDGASRLAGAANAMSSVSELSHTNHQETMGRDEAVFVAGFRPDGKAALLQVLNPGFDQAMWVVPDPAGRETSGVSVGGVQMSGGILKSYLVLRRGQTQAVLVKKGSYEEQWDQLFGDCAALQRPASIDFDHLAADVAAHAQACPYVPE